MRYAVNANSRSTYDVLDDYKRPIGRLNYLTWFRTEAQVLTAMGVRYDFTPRGFFRQKISITREGTAFAELTYTWRGGMAITFAGGGSLVFKKRGFFDSAFVILGSNDSEVAIIESEFRWSRMAFDYFIDVRDNALGTELNALLPFIALYCTHSMRKRYAAG